jgi:hypothetical protein
MEGQREAFVYSVMAPGLCIFWILANVGTLFRHAICTANVCNVRLKKGEKVRSDRRHIPSIEA